MKRALVYPLFLAVFFIFQLQNVFGFEKTKPDSLQLFYILDDVWYPSLIHPYKRDDSPSYLQVFNNEVIITGRFFGVKGFRHIYMYGIIDGLKKSTAANGDQIIVFYIRGRRRSSGYVRSIEITIKNKNDIKIHFFNKLGLWEVFLTAHKASEVEINAIHKYWKDKGY